VVDEGMEGVLEIYPGFIEAFDIEVYASST
jgi:hypothetical protein